MNRIPAQIGEIHEHEGVSSVFFEAHGQNLAMIALELPEGTAPGRKVVLGIKATHITLAKTPLPQAAIANQIPVTVERVNEGEILVSFLLRFGDTALESIVLKQALPEPPFREGEEAVALFQASELSIVEVL